jgi:hypothetical protein
MSDEILTGDDSDVDVVDLAVATETVLEPWAQVLTALLSNLDSPEKLAEALAAREDLDPS